DGTWLRVTDFRDGTTESIDTSVGPEDSTPGGHGGGDVGLVRAFVAAVAAGDPSLVPSDEETSLATHRIVWAAERARHAGTVEDVTVRRGMGHGT
ncbi:MAG: hypothetical protein ACRCYX_13520, partial [Dermatophilaceae bacterium]